MKIQVRAKPGAKQSKIEKSDETHFEIWVRELPKDGQANIAIQEALADYFNISPSRVLLKSGFTSRNKVFEII